MAPSLSFFPTQTTQGIALRDALVLLAKELGFTVKVKQPVWATVLWSLQYDDVVVFDASIETMPQPETLVSVVCFWLRH